MEWMTGLMSNVVWSKDGLGHICHNMQRLQHSSNDVLLVIGIVANKLGSDSR